MGNARGYIPSKERFCAILDGIRDQGDAASKLDKLISDSDEFRAARDFFSAYCLVASGHQEMIDLLCDVFDARSEIESFCFEHDFGRSYEEGAFTVDGENIDMSSSAALYDHLASRLAGNQCWNVVYTDPSRDHDWGFLCFEDEEAARKASRELYDAAVDVDFGRIAASDFQDRLGNLEQSPGVIGAGQMDSSLCFPSPR